MREGKLEVGRLPNQALAAANKELRDRGGDYPSLILFSFLLCCQSDGSEPSQRPAAPLQLPAAQCPCPLPYMGVPNKYLFQQ